MSNQTLLLINGPVASGKTTVAQLVAARMRERKRRAAAIDLDALVMVVMGRDWHDVRIEHWLAARRLAAVLADCLFSTEHELVVLSGPFFTQEERDDLCRHLKSRPKMASVTLRVSFDVALRRAQSDPDPARLYTRVPERLAQLHDSIDWDLLPSDVLMIDTDRRDADEVARVIAEALFCTVQ